MSALSSSSALRRPFRLIAFDWDGTAVADRKDDAGPLVGPVERLLRSGVSVVIVTGTSFRNVDAQFSGRLHGPHKHYLHVATNRGSEVFGFDDRDGAFLEWHRCATAEEDERLTRVAEAVRDTLTERTGLDIRIIYDRLNRRKIDLIPLERWRDPPKSAFGELLAAVETRLESAGLSGIGEAVAQATRIARDQGLPSARITSDVKHIEIGLTDKSDALRWVWEALVRPAGLESRDVLVAGDEFGAIAGFSGSDSLMMIPEAAGATFVSVGVEPGGVPDPVIHLGGGPREFSLLLRAQAALQPVAVLSSSLQKPNWSLVDTGTSLSREREFESIFAISNGFLGTRASLPEGTPSSSPATFVAGLFEPEPGSVPTMVRLMDWMNLSITVGGHPVRFESGENLLHRRILDLNHASLSREWRFRDPAGRITLFRGLRFASLADRHLLVQTLSFTPENYTGSVTIEGRLSAPSLIITASGTRVASAVGLHAETPDGAAGEASVDPSRPSSPDAERVTIHAELGRAYRLDRVVAVHTSRDCQRPSEEAREHVARALGQGVPRLYDAHCQAWRERWAASDVLIDGDETAQKALRFAAYHLISSANPDDPYYSIGARALTGQAYKGHVFWDTEIYMLPFFILTYPEAARALLLYRYNTLPGARAKAARKGYRGAMYAWESADTGEEVTPPFVVAPDGELIPIRVGDEEQHITADIAFAVWSYWEATGDEAFFLEAGAEILLETARFWASRVEPGEDGRYHIRQVIGPDEYHESVDDNAFTNGMAQYNLELGAKAATLLASKWPDAFRELTQRLRLGADEPAEWVDRASGMYTGFDPSTRLFEQFRGYFDLAEMELPSFEHRNAPADVLLGRARVQASKIIKQPDVLMLLYLQWDRFSAEVREANFRYYEPRTGHGSSLSPPIHALLAARLGDSQLADGYLRQTIEIDLSDNMGNAAGGIHAAALGGLWQSIVFGFAGLHLSAQGPRLSPRLPERWRRLAFSFKWRDEWLRVDLPNRPQGFESSSNQVAS